MQHRLWWNRPCRTWMHSSSSVHDLTSINMDCSHVLLHSWDMELGSLVPIPSLEGREAQHGEVVERRVLAPGSSLACCHSGHVLLPAWTSDISAVKWGHWVRGFSCCSEMSSMTLINKRLARSLWHLGISKLWEHLLISFWIPGLSGWTYPVYGIFGSIHRD